jgi:hypothetical protein
LNKATAAPKRAAVASFVMALNERALPISARFRTLDRLDTSVAAVDFMTV